MKTRSFRPLVPALVLIGFALVMGAIAAGYPQGSLLRPGPGFFPLSIAVLLAGLGLTVGAEAWRGGAAPTEGRFAWRPLLSTVTAMLAFALLLERAGFVPAALALTAIAALAEPRLRPLGALAVGLFMALFGTALFIWGLGLPISPFGAS